MKRALSLVVVASAVACSSSGSGTSGSAKPTADTTGGTNSVGGSGGAPSNAGGSSSGGRPNGGWGGALEGTSGGAPTETSDGGPADSGGIDASDALAEGSSRGSFGSWDKDPRLEPLSTLGDCDLGGAVTQNVAVLPDGTAFGAWECNEGGSHVYASCFVPGSGWSAPVVLSAEPLYTMAIALAVAASATGNAVVAWSDTVLVDGSYRFVIRAAHFGSTWEPEVTISSAAYSAYYATGFSLHADAHGDFLAAWDEISAAPAVANPLTAVQPSVAIDGAGNAVVAWMEDQQRPYASTFHGTWSAAALAAASVVRR